MGSTTTVSLPIEKLLLFFTTFCSNYSRFLKNYPVISRFSNVPHELNRNRLQRSDISSILCVERDLQSSSHRSYIPPPPSKKKKKYDAEPPCYEKNVCKTKMLTLEVSGKYFSIIYEMTEICLHQKDIQIWGKSYNICKNFLLFSYVSIIIPIFKT